MLDSYDMNALVSRAVRSYVKADLDIKITPHWHRDCSETVVVEVCYMGVTMRYSCDSRLIDNMLSYVDTALSHEREDERYTDDDYPMWDVVVFSEKGGDLFTEYIVRHAGDHFYGSALDVIKQARDIISDAVVWAAKDSLREE